MGFARFFGRLITVAAIATLGFGTAARAAADPAEVMSNWYKLILELVRHTPTYSPPVAARSFGYLGVVAYEATASGDAALTTLAGQVNGLTPLPAREGGAEYDEGAVMEAALTASVEYFFSNTGPTGQRAKAAMAKQLGAKAAEGVDPAVLERSRAYGQAVADHIIAWSETDGGAKIENMGFPYSYDAPKGPGLWVPTSLIVQQQMPLLPEWGKVRPFAMPDGASCDLPPPPEYSEDPASVFYKEAKEVYDTSKSLTDEQKLIARFWSDDPMLTWTPTGHWIYLAMQLLDEDGADAARRAEVLARLGMATADAFIGCWQTKYEYNLLRPVTYIRKVIDPKWETLLITPPFPEYPSGHSTQSGAAAAVMNEMFGTDRAFDDAAHEDEGMAARHFANFDAAAEEAALSRLYGGIHFRAAIERGLDQGRCIATHVTALRMGK